MGRRSVKRLANPISPDSFGVTDLASQAEQPTFLSRLSSVTDSSFMSESSSLATNDVGSGVAFGFNLSGGLFVDGSETIQQCHDRYLSSFNLARLPIAKVFRSGTPTTWSSTSEGVVSGRRVIACYNPSSTVSAAAAGADDTKIASWAASVPRDWDVKFVFWQEADDNIQAGQFTAADYKAVYARHYPLIKAAQKAPSGALRGNNLELWSCFSTPFNLGLSAATSASWLPSPAVCDGYGWDCYLNPNGQQLPGHSGDIRYNTDYRQDWPTRMQRALDVNALNGMDRWGIMESGAPWRNWDSDGTARDTFMTEGLDYVEAPPQGLPGEFFCFFDSDNPSSNWDQRLVAAGIPTVWDHTHGPNAALDTNPTPAVPAAMLPDEPFTLTYGARIRSGLYSAYIGAS